MGAWQPGAVSAATLVVQDVARAQEFYARAFGLSPVFTDADSAVFRLGGLLVNLLAATAAVELVGPATVGPPGAGARAVYTVEVDDVDAVCAELAERGVTLLNGPVDRPWGPRTASFADPDGHVWEIAHQ